VIKMPYKVKKQSCKKTDGTSGTHVVTKAGGDPRCTDDPEGYMAALHIHAKDESKEPADMKTIMEDWRQFLKEAAKDYVWGVKGVHRIGNKFGGWVPIKRKESKKR